MHWCAMIFYVLHIESFCDTHIIDLWNILEDFNHRQQKNGKKSAVHLNMET